MKTKVAYSGSFKKAYKKRIAKRSNLEKRVQERVDLFIQDRENPILRDHALKGKKHQYRAFSIGGDLRIIYYEDQSKDDLLAVFIDIGTHNQVY